MVNKIQKFFSGIEFEMKKVSWPDWQELKGSAYVVINLTLILTVFLFLIDFILAKIINYIL
tara:strand:+ start:252 stop:434 length:183 start_codon:yes stop_codon:yes gene_type:complete